VPSSLEENFQSATTPNQQFTSQTDHSKIEPIEPNTTTAPSSTISELETFSSSPMTSTTKTTTITTTATTTTTITIANV
jgi:hypothetical protein